MRTHKTAQTWRLYTSTNILQQGEIYFDGDNFHYLTNVLRLEPGSLIEISDGLGQVAYGILESIEKKRCQVRVSEITKHPPRRTRVLVYVGWPKPANIDELVTTTSELGAAEIHLVRTEKSQCKQIPRIDRLTKIAWESLRISKSPWAPELHVHQDLNSAIAKTPQDSLSFLCDESPLYRNDGICHNHLLSELLLHKGFPATIAIFIGPEASFTDNERTLILEKLTARPVSLGENILRVPVAAGMATMLALSAISTFGNYQS